MNRVFNGELTPATARLLVRMSAFHPLTLPDSIHALCEDKDDFSDLFEKDADIAQFITDMKFRCTIMNRNKTREELMTPICAAIIRAGYDTIVHGFNQNSKISGLTEIDLPSSADEVINLRHLPLLIDIDRSSMLDKVIFRIFPKVIIYGAKVTQYNLLSSDPIGISAESLYPAVGHALQIDKIQKNNNFRKMVAGLYVEV